MTSEKAVYVTVESSDIKLIIEFDYTPGRGATRDDPPETAEISIKSIRHEDGVPVHQHIFDAVEASDQVCELLCEEGEFNVEEEEHNREKEERNRD